MRMAPGFARQGLKVVIPGPLSDQQRLGYVFRSSKEHREDLQALMAELNGQSLPFWVAASSRDGTGSSTARGFTRGIDPTGGRIIFITFEALFTAWPPWIWRPGEAVDEDHNRLDESIPKRMN